MKAQPTTRQLIEMLYERLPELFDRAAAQPAPDCKETGVCIQTGLACFGQPAPVQDSTCSETLRAQGKACPRTCRKCGLGPCIGAPKQPPAAQPAPVPMAHIVGEIDHNGKVWTPAQPTDHSEQHLDRVKAQPAQEPVCPKCGNNRQVWDNQITGIKTCHRVGCHSEITAQPAQRPQNCGTGYCSCIECVMEPAVPDAFGTREGEHPQYIQGWNDCRAETLKMRKP